MWEVGACGTAGPNLNRLSGAVDIAMQIGITADNGFTAAPSHAKQVTLFACPAQVMDTYAHEYLYLGAVQFVKQVGGHVRLSCVCSKQGYGNIASRL
jgi:hypothetical protein